tara:strand:- start:187 stop:1365 length:1179 start_codon:yes stop_codon:yes gene_type:complete
MVRFIQDTLTKGQNYNPGLLDLRNTNWSVDEIVDKINQTNLPGANSPLFDNDRIDTLIEVFGDTQKELGVDDASVNNQKAVLQDYFSKVSLGKNNENTVNRLVGNMTQPDIATRIAAGFTTNPVAFQTEGVSYLADQPGFGGSGDPNQEFSFGATDAMSGMTPSRGPGGGPGNGNGAAPPMIPSDVDPLGNLGLNFDDQPFTQFVQGISNLYGDQFRRGPFRRQIQGLFNPLQTTFNTLAQLNQLGLPGGLQESAQLGGGAESFGEYLSRLGGLAAAQNTGIGNIGRQQFADAFSALRGFTPSNEVFGATANIYDPLGTGSGEGALFATQLIDQALQNRFRSPVYRSLRRPSAEELFADYQLGRAGQGAFAPTFSGTDTPTFLEFAAQRAGL